MSHYLENVCFAYIFIHCFLAHSPFRHLSPEPSLIPLPSPALVCVSLLCFYSCLCLFCNCPYRIALKMSIYIPVSLIRS